MHYSTLVAGEMPAIQENPVENLSVKLDLLSLQRRYITGEDSLALKIQIGALRSRLTTFSREVFDWIGEVLAPYDQNTEDSEYIEFFDETEKVEQYDTETCTFIKLPDGKLIFPFESLFSSKFEIRNGKVYQLYFDAKKCFEEKDTTKFLGSCIKEEGLVDWGKVRYLKDETLQEFLHREHLDDSVKYPVGFYQFLSEKTGFIESNPNYSAGLGERVEAEYDWDEQINRFIDGLDDNCVLVCVDCHC